MSEKFVEREYPGLDEKTVVPVEPSDVVAAKLNEVLDDPNLKDADRRQLLEVANQLGYRTAGGGGARGERASGPVEHKFDLGSLLAQRAKDPKAFEKFVQLQEVDRRRTEELERRNQLLREEVELLQKLNGADGQIPAGTIHERQFSEAFNLVLKEALTGDRILLVHQRNGLIVSSYEILERAPIVKSSLLARIKGLFGKS